MKNPYKHLAPLKLSIAFTNIFHSCRPDEESPMKLDLNVSFSSESSFSSSKHLGLQSNCSVDMQGKVNNIKALERVKNERLRLNVIFFVSDDR